MVHTMLGLFDLEIDYWPHLYVSGAYLLYYSYLSSNVAYARPFLMGGGIRHVTVTFLVL